MRSFSGLEPSTGRTRTFGTARKTVGRTPSACSSFSCSTCPDSCSISSSVRVRRWQTPTSGAWRPRPSCETYPLPQPIARIAASRSATSTSFAQTATRGSGKPARTARGRSSWRGWRVRTAALPVRTRVRPLRLPPHRRRHELQHRPLHRLQRVRFVHKPRLPKGIRHRRLATSSLRHRHPGPSPRLSRFGDESSASVARSKGFPGLRSGSVEQWSVPPFARRQSASGRRVRQWSLPCARYFRGPAAR